MKTSPKYTEEEKQLAVELWQMSGQTQHAFSQQEGLVRSTFQRWVKKYGSAKPNEQHNSFVPVQVSNTGPEVKAKPTNLTIHYPNGVKLTGLDGLSSSELLALIGTA